ncbi:YciI family protein [Nesterenkonia marinintestina]|uniref:YciI family protein n=1 Tax=Nesterenkonia marinintestina TaxID=2979865 RepID=UPI0021BFD747|nr:YciI family protein [Nesterenkonia sp. GX14115]
MKYVLLLMANLTDARCGEESPEAPTVEEFMAFDAELEEAGVLAGGFGLSDPEEGTIVTKRDRDAEPVVTSGPYAESREFVGGTIVIDVKDLDEALHWAGRCPGAVGGRVEIRPMLEF